MSDFFGFTERYLSTDGKEYPEEEALTDAERVEREVERWRK